MTARNLPLHHQDPCQAHDAKAAHFLRHEVKNGVLAAMGIVESLQEVYLKLQQDQQQIPQGQESPLLNHLTELNTTLAELLGRVVDSAMTLEVVHNAYTPTAEAVDLPTLLSSSVSQTSSRFPVLAQANFPQLLLDPNLFRTIHSKGLSNACKYGKQEGLVTTHLNYDHSRQLVQMQVVNEPGPGHEQLLQLTPQDRDTIFQEQTQLPCHQGALVSEGNGGWIMYHCAKTVGGHCSISFEPHRTVMTFECPAKVTPDWAARQHATFPPLNVLSNKTPLPFPAQVTSPSAFKLPENCWSIVLEDSPVQRKMLQRYLERAGVRKDRCIVWGQTQQEIQDFVPNASKLIQEHTMDTFLLLVDEHLDIVEGGVVTKTVSGSYSVQQLRQTLLPAHEARVLALVRSANDSAQDQQLYQQRAHGWIAKGPLKQGSLLQAIQPWWEKRFTMPSWSRSGLSSSPPGRVPPRRRSRRSLTMPRKWCDSWQKKQLSRSSEQLRIASLQRQLLLRRAVQRSKSTSSSNNNNASWGAYNVMFPTTTTTRSSGSRGFKSVDSSKHDAMIHRSYKSTPALAYKYRYPLLDVDHSISSFGQEELFFAS